MNDPLQRFRELTRELADLGRIKELLDWDHQVMMPPRGGEQRGHEQAALSLCLHQRLIANELGDLMAELEDAERAHPTPGEEGEWLRADLRELHRRRDRALRLPESLVTRHARACVIAQGVWQDARARDDFSAFQPHLDEVMGLAREMGLALAAGGDRYDALLDEYEPGMTRASAAALLGELEAGLVPLQGRIRARGPRGDERVLRRAFSEEGQERFVRRVTQDMGFDYAAGRLDRSAHPFTSGDLHDVRITTAYQPDDLRPSLFAAIHEAGHGLYQQGLPEDRYRDPAGTYCSLGVHESQSRLWENIIGRSRAFWTYYLPVLRETIPGLLDDVDLDAFVAAVNQVRPSLIRVEADEVTYNLHVLLRFRLETAMLDGDLQTADLPGAWAEGMQGLLGIVPDDDRTGCLQDIHWSAGIIGYFPTYTIGNLLSAQLWNAMTEEKPDLEADLTKGELRPIRQWLGEKVHRHGRRFSAEALCVQATGKPLGVQPFLAYLEGKYLL